VKRPVSCKSRRHLITDWNYMTFLFKALLVYFVLLYILTLLVEFNVISILLNLLIILFKQV
jgi:hypothetical protein